MIKNFLNVFIREVQIKQFYVIKPGLQEPEPVGAGVFGSSSATLPKILLSLW